MDLSALISSVLQNPEITGILSSMGMNSRKASDTPEDIPPKDSEGSISIPPEIMAKLPQMMSALSGISGISKKEGSSPSPTGKDSQRSALLKALRPYLSERRRSVIDGMLGLESVAKVLGTLKDFSDGIVTIAEGGEEVSLARADISKLTTVYKEKNI